MKKTSVYLEDEDVRRLARLAKNEGTSQAEIIRRAISSYVPHNHGRGFALTRSGTGPGDSIADIPENELLERFGE